MERYGSRADTAVFLGCLVLSLAALALPDGLRAPIAGALRRTVLAPALALEATSARAAANRARLESLRAQRDSLALFAAELPALARENARLRALLGLGRRLGTGFVTAEVLHQAGFADGMSLVLSAGRAEGVQPLSAVIAPEGLVGLVRAVDRHTSIALAWTHPDFRASAMVEPDRVYGIVGARRTDRSVDELELRGVAFRVALAPGTPVVTSGLGGVFPRGIPIGTVQGVLRESAGWERTYLLRPAVHPGEVSHVMILMPARPEADVTSAFADTLAAGTAAGVVSASPAPRPQAGRRAAPGPSTP